MAATHDYTQALDAVLSGGVRGNFAARKFGVNYDYLMQQVRAAKSKAQPIATTATTPTQPQPPSELANLVKQHQEAYKAWAGAGTAKQEDLAHSQCTDTMTKIMGLLDLKSPPANSDSKLQDQLDKLRDELDRANDTIAIQQEQIAQADKKIAALKAKGKPKPPITVVELVHVDPEIVQ